LTIRFLVVRLCAIVVAVVKSCFGRVRFVLFVLFILFKICEKTMSIKTSIDEIDRVLDNKPSSLKPVVGGTTGAEETGATTGGGGGIGVMSSFSDLTFVLLALSETLSSLIDSTTATGALLFDDTGFVDDTRVEVRRRDGPGGVDGAGVAAVAAEGAGGGGGGGNGDIDTVGGVTSSFFTSTSI
jgi:hypothetical protein